MFELALLPLILLGLIILFFLFALGFTSYKIYDGVAGLFRADPQPIQVSAPAVKNHVSGRPLTRFEKDTEAELQLVNDTVVSIVAGASREWDRLKECCSRDSVAEPMIADTGVGSIAPVTTAVQVSRLEASLFNLEAGLKAAPGLRPFMKEGRIHYASSGAALNAECSVAEALFTLKGERIAADREREALCLVLQRIVDLGLGDRTLC